jgi:hypothetical protein
MSAEQQQSLLENPHILGALGLLASALIAGITGHLKRVRRKDELILKLQARVQELEIELQDKNDRIREREDQLIELATKNNAEMLASHATIRAVNDMIVRSMSRSQTPQPRQYLQNDKESPSNSG